jgi:hypothetical protein
MHRLADVELQLILHGLDGKERIQFACCSHRSLSVRCSVRLEAPPASAAHSLTVRQTHSCRVRSTCRYISISFH